MEQGGCTAAEPFALQVIGDSMAPEFNHGHIVIVDPGMSIYHGAYAVIEYQGETILRQFIVEGERQLLRALNVRYPSIELTGSYKVHGIVVQRGGTRRKEIKHYPYPRT